MTLEIISWTGANFSYADLKGANLSYADLSGVNFSYADLRGADLTKTNQKDVNWEGVILVGTRGVEKD